MPGKELLETVTCPSGNAAGFLKGTPNVPETKVKIKTTTTREHRLELTHEDLVLLLKPNFQVPSCAEIYIRVPGGGDWSNQDLIV